MARMSMDSIRGRVSPKLVIILTNFFCKSFKNKTTCRTDDKIPAKIHPNKIDGYPSGAEIGVTRFHFIRLRR